MLGVLKQIHLLYFIKLVFSIIIAIECVATRMQFDIKHEQSVSKKILAVTIDADGKNEFIH